MDAIHLTASHPGIIRARPLVAISLAVSGLDVEIHKATTSIPTPAKNTTIETNPINRVRLFILSLPVFC